MFAPIFTSRRQLFKSRLRGVCALAESSASRYCGQAGGNRAARCCPLSFLDMQVCIPVRKLAAICKCPAKSDGAYASWHNPVPWFSCDLTKTSLSGLGGREPLPSLLKQVRASVHSSFPKGCLDSRWWPGHWLKWFGLKVIGSLLAFLFHVLHDRLWQTVWKVRRLWIKTTNDRSVETSRLVKIQGSELWIRGIWLIHCTSSSIFLVLEQVDPEVHF